MCVCGWEGVGGGEGGGIDDSALSCSLCFLFEHYSFVSLVSPLFC